MFSGLLCIMHFKNFSSPIQAHLYINQSILTNTTSTLASFYRYHLLRQKNKFFVKKNGFVTLRSARGLSTADVIGQL